MNRTPKIRVLHVFNKITFSGAEIMYSSAGRFFLSNNVVLFALDTSDSIGDFSKSLKKSGYEILHLKYEKNVRLIFKIYKLIKNYDINVVHIHREQGFLFYVIAAWLSNVLIIRTLHSSYNNNRLKRILTRKLSRSLHVKFTSIGSSVYFNELKKFKNKTFQINNWFNNEKYYPGSNNEKIRIRRDNGISNNKVVILSVGSCIDLKNHDHILMALNHLKSNSNHEFIYYHIGTGPNEADEKRHAKELNLQDNIYYLKQVHDLRDYYLMSDIFVMPSEREGLSITLLEAMACGLVPIVYNSQGLVDIVNNEKNGIITRKNDYLSLAESIEKLANNIELSKQLANRAIVEVNKNYSLINSCSSFFNLYKSVLDD